MVAIQAAHYIFLAALVPPLLAIFTEPAPLRFEGGPAQVGMIIDWREMASRPTWDWDALALFQPAALENATAAMSPDEAAAAAHWTAGAVWLQAAYVHNASVPRVVPPAEVTWLDAPRANRSGAALPDARGAGAADTALQQEEQLEAWEYRRTHDERRGWAISAAWLAAVAFEYVAYSHSVPVIYFLVRKPTHMLDFVATMHVAHLVVTSCYARALPLSLFWWLVMGVHATLCVVLAERLAIQREMRVGFTEPAALEAQHDDDIEMRHALR